MSAYLRGLVSAYRDILRKIERIDPNEKDQNLSFLYDFINSRIDKCAEKELNKPENLD